MIREFTTSKTVDLHETKVDLLTYNAAVTALEEAIALKAPFLDPVLLNSAVLPANTTIGTVSPTEISYLGGVTDAIQTQLDAKAPLDSPAFTGVPTAPTATTGANDTQIASTAFVQQELTGVSDATQTQLDAKAPLDSPAFTGVPTAPTATTGTNDTQIASTAFVQQELTGVTDAIQTQLDAKAPLDSPAFTGVPTAPTATTGTNDTQIASTAFVQQELTGVSDGVSAMLMAFASAHG